MPQLQSRQNNDIDQLDIENIKNLFKGLPTNVNFDDTQPSQKVNNKKISLKCDNCDKSNTIIEDYSQGILVCKNCGQVADDVLDHNPEWKAYDCNGAADIGRCGGMPINMLLPQSSVGTTIAGYGRNRVKMLQSWSAMPYRERTLNNDFKIIHNVCETLRVSKCIEDDSKILYAIAFNTKHVIGKSKGKYIIIRGNNRKGLMGAGVFFACIKNGITITNIEIAKAFKIGEDSIGGGKKTLEKILIKRQTLIHIGHDKPSNHIRTYCSNPKHKFKRSDAEVATKIAENIEKLNICTAHMPHSLAVASILMAAKFTQNKDITKIKLAKDFDITVATISKTYRDLEPYKNILLNNDASDKILQKITQTPQIVPDAVKKRMEKFGVSMDPNLSLHEKVRLNIIKIKALTKYDNTKILFDTFDLLFTSRRVAGSC